jgi:hypothetical protein
MNKSALGIIVALVIAGAFGFRWQQQTNDRLRTEIDELKRQAVVIAATPKSPPPGMTEVSSDDLERLRAEHAELTRLRDEVTTLKTRTDDLARAAKAAQVQSRNEPPPPLASEMRPARSWKNSGLSSPTATFETAIWAASQGDIDVLATTVGFQPEGRARLESLFASLPPETRAQFGSPEKVFATLLASKIPTDMDGFGLVSQTEKSPDEVVLRMRMQRGEGKTKDDTFPTHRDADGMWRLIVPDKAVESYTRMLKDGGPKG